MQEWVCDGDNCGHLRSSMYLGDWGPRGSEVTVRGTARISGYATVSAMTRGCVAATHGRMQSDGSAGTHHPRPSRDDAFLGVVDISPR